MVLEPTTLSAYLELQEYAKHRCWRTQLVWTERDRRTKERTIARLVLVDVAGGEVEGVRVVNDLNHAAESLLRFMAHLEAA